MCRPECKHHDHNERKDSSYSKRPVHGLTFIQQPAGSFIETSLSTESEKSQLVHNQPNLRPIYDGRFVDSIQLTRSINRNQFLINKSPSDQRPPVSLIKQNPNDGESPLDSVQMKFFVREMLDATPRSRAASQGGSRRETGRNDLDAPNGDPPSNLRFTRTNSRDCAMI